MHKTDDALEKLERIQNLWEELGRTKVSDPEYETLMKKIRALSAEYQALIDSPRSDSH
jgi:hypothetical protein